MDVVTWETSGGCSEFLFLCRKHHTANESSAGTSQKAMNTWTYVYYMHNQLDKKITYMRLSKSAYNSCSECTE